MQGQTIQQHTQNGISGTKTAMITDLNQILFTRLTACIILTRALDLNRIFQKVPAFSSTTALSVCANDDSLARPARDAEPATLVRIAENASADGSASAARARYDCRARHQKFVSTAENWVVTRSFLHIHGQVWIWKFDFHRAAIAVLLVCVFSSVFSFIAFTAEFLAFRVSASAISENKKILHELFRYLVTMATDGKATTHNVFVTMMTSTGTGPEVHVTCKLLTSDAFQI